MKSFYSAFVGFILLLLFVTPLSGMSKTTILVLGDSIAAGYGIEKESAFPALLERRLKELNYDVRVINGGISGSTSASGKGRMKWYLRIKPNILLLELGANDGLRGLSTEAMKQNLTETIQIAREKNLKVILAGMKMPLNYGKAYTTAFENAFKEVAEELNVTFIPFLLDGVAGNPELNLPDGIHPTAEGHRIITQTVLNYLKPLLK